jgi:hypothetical protein
LPGVAKSTCAIPDQIPQLGIDSGSAAGAATLLDLMADPARQDFIERATIFRSEVPLSAASIGIAITNLVMMVFNQMRVKNQSAGVIGPRASLAPRKLGVSRRKRSVVHPCRYPTAGLMASPYRHSTEG